jgi:hypothetical protein
MSKAANTDDSQPTEQTESTGDTLSGPGEITADAFFDLLSNRRRRYALHCLEQRGETADLGDVARQVAAWENGKEVDAISASERKSVYTSLQQFHLPKLDEKGVVEFDQREGTVEPGPATEEFDIYMEVVERGSIPWSHYYLSLTGVHTLAIVAAYVGFVSGIAVATFCVTTLALSVLAHTYYTKTEMRLGTGETPPEPES